MFTSKEETAAMFCVVARLAVKPRRFFFLPFSGDVLVFCLKTLRGPLSLTLPEKYCQCTTDSVRKIFDLNRIRCQTHDMED